MDVRGGCVSSAPETARMRNENSLGIAAKERCFVWSIGGCAPQPRLRSAKGHLKFGVWLTHILDRLIWTTECLETEGESERSN